MGRSGGAGVEGEGFEGQRKDAAVTSTIVSSSNVQCTDNRAE